MKVYGTAVICTYLLFLCIVPDIRFANAETRLVSESMANAPIPKPFLYFDATLYSHKPDLSSMGMVPLPMIYQGRLWKERADLDTVPSSFDIESAISGVGEATSVCFDIEHWRLGGNDFDRSLSKYIEFARRVRLENPRIKFGFYGAAPIRDYWRALKGDKSDKYREWQSENRRLEPLARSVDIIFPSLYTFYHDREGWRRYAIEQLKAARSYGRPVYAFLWPSYHNSNKLLGGSYIGDAYWRLELDTVRQYADGVVIWGGWGDGKPSEWDEQAPWWRVTREFLQQDTDRGTD